MPGTAELAKAFGSRVRALRNARGLSRDRLAAIVGLSPAAVARLERGERFNAANLAPLAVAFGVEVRDLFTFDHAGSPEITRIVDLLRTATGEQLATVERLVRALLAK